MTATPANETERKTDNIQIPKPKKKTTTTKQNANFQSNVIQRTQKPMEHVVVYIDSP